MRGKSPAALLRHEPSAAPYAADLVILVFEREPEAQLFTCILPVPTHLLIDARIPERVSLNITDFFKIVTSIAIRMAFIAPLLFEATKAVLGHQPSMRIVPFKNHPQFYVDIYLFAVSYVACVLDVIPGLAKYAIEYPKAIADNIRKKIGSDEPF